MSEPFHNAAAAHTSAIAAGRIPTRRERRTGGGDSDWSREKQNAPAAAIAAASRQSDVTLNRPESRSGTTATQAAAAPARSHAYSRPTGALVRVSAIVTTIPEKKKGTARTAVTAAIATTSMTENRFNAGIGMHRQIR